MEMFETVFVLWLCFAIVLGVIELIVPHLITVWLAIAALITSVVAYFLPEAFLMQCTVFLGITALLLLTTRPIAIRYLYSKEPEFTDTVLGEEATITNIINAELGEYEVKVHGQRWVALSSDTFAIHETGIVMSQKGNKLHIRKSS